MTGIYSKYRKYFRGLGDHILFLKLLAFVLFFPVIKWIYRKRPLEDFLKFFTPDNVRPKGKSDKVLTYVEWILNRNILWIKPVCLIKCLIVFRFWKLEGVPVVIKFGVMRPENDLMSHCWLEIDGEPVVEDPRGEYKDIYSYPEVRDESKTCHRPATIPGN